MCTVCGFNIIYIEYDTEYDILMHFEYEYVWTLHLIAFIFFSIFDLKKYH